MQTKDFQLKVKALDDSGAFTGIASPYGDPPDLVGDVIQPGAFSQAIRQQGKGYPLLWAHKQEEPLGLARIEDSEKGLVVNGELVMEDPNAQRAFAHMKAGSMKGLSIGYQPVAGKLDYRDDGTRVLREIRLFEISVVAIPAAPRAQIAAVKTLGDVRHILHALRSETVDETALDDLREIDAELKALLAAHDPHRDDVLRELAAFAVDLKTAARIQ